MKWTLRDNAKRAYPLACRGDETALADIRAYIDTLRKNRNRNRWLNQPANRKKKKMKNRMKLIAASALAACAFTLSGCKNFTPQQAKVATSFAVYEVGKNKPQTVDYMRRAQPLACAAVTNGATVQTIADVIATVAGADVEEKDAIDLILSVFQTATMNTKTNALAPYLTAVFCDGWRKGLDDLQLPATRGVNVPPRWVLMPRRDGRR